MVLVRSHRLLIIIIKVFRWRDFRSLVCSLGRCLEAISGISLVAVTRSLLLTRRTILVLLSVGIVECRSKRRTVLGILKVLRILTLCWKT